MRPNYTTRWVPFAGTPGSTPSLDIDDERLTMTRRLADEEGLLAGGSSGMAVVGALRVAIERPDDLVVVLLPDSGRNYLSKIFNDDWMRDQGLL